MKKIFLLLLFFHSCYSIAQLDSLKHRLLTVNGKEKLEVLNKLTVLDSSPAFSEYHRQALLLARQMNDKPGEIHALCAMGEHYDDLLPDSAILFYTKGLVLAKQYKLSHEIIKCLNKSAMAMENKSEYDRASVFYKEELFESRKSGDNNEIVDALEHNAIFFYNQRIDSSALNCFNEELELLTRLKDSSSMAGCLNNIGLVYYSSAAYATSFTYYEMSLAIYKRINDTTGIAQSLANTAIAYKDQGIYDLALKNSLEALRYFEKGDDSQELGSCYNTIGLMFMELDQPEEALKYHFKSLSIRQNLKYKKGIAGSYTNIGEVYKVQGKYDVALDYLNKSLKIKEELGNKTLLASSLDLIGEVYFLKHDYIQSESFYLKSMKLKEEAGDPKGKAITSNNLGELYFEWGKYNLAIMALDEGRKIAMDIGAKAILLNNYETTIKLLREQKKFIEALSYYDKYTILKNDLLNEQKNKAITELQIKYETEKIKQKIILLDERQKSQAAVVSKQHILIYSLTISAFLLVIIIVLIYKAYSSGKKVNAQNQVIIEQKQVIIEQKQNVMSELHHRVKNNLQVLSSVLNLQQERLENNSIREAIQAVEHRLNAMLLIHQDLYGEKIDSQVNIADYIKRLVENLLFSFGYSEEEIKINLSADELYLEADKALSIGFICNEVISNSFKHAFTKTEHSELSISLKRENDSIKLLLGDNGPGMQIKTDFKNVNSFGLRLIHMFTQDMEGKLKIVSDQEGSRFEFSIPVKHFNI
jgi:two-component sensor histidine kinase